MPGMSNRHVFSEPEAAEICHCAYGMTLEWEGLASPTRGSSSLFCRVHYESMRDDLLAIANDYRLPRDRREAALATLARVETLGRQHLEDARNTRANLLAAPLDVVRGLEVLALGSRDYTAMINLPFEDRAKIEVALAWIDGLRPAATGVPGSGVAVNS